MAGKKGGRPRHKPTKTTRDLAASLAFADLSQAEIAFEMKLSIPTLMKHYEDDIKYGKARVVAAMMSVGITHALDPNHPDSMKERHYYLDRKGGFHKKKEVDLNVAATPKTLQDFYGGVPDPAEKPKPKPRAKARPKPKAKPRGRPKASIVKKITPKARRKPRAKKAAPKKK